MRMKILAIETSCDETAVCIMEAEGDFGPDFRFNILGNALYSQVEAHAPYGGVFPNLAKREHERNLVPLLVSALERAGMVRKGRNPAHPELGNILSRERELLAALLPFIEEYEKPDVDAIAVTAGPGLEPALWVGVNFARALASVWNLPVVPVNHMEGHVLLSMVAGDRLAKFEFPALALLISGGHTELVLSKEFGSYELIGATRDDAVGEAFDKVARMLGLPYPGGAALSTLAHEARETGAAPRFTFPRPMLNQDNFDFSFAGLKTEVRKHIPKDDAEPEETRREIARGFEDAVTEVLVRKTLAAAERFGANTIVVGGGVSANRRIREELRSAIGRAGNPAKLLIPPPEYATDNAIMIAIAGYFRARRGMYADPASLRASGNLPLAPHA